MTGLTAKFLIRSFERLLRGLYFNIVRKRPWLEFKSSTAWTDNHIRGVVEGIFSTPFHDDQGKGVVVELGWATEPIQSQPSYVILSAVRKMKQIVDTLFEARILETDFSSGHVVGFQPLLNRLELLLAQQASDLLRTLPMNPQWELLEKVSSGQPEIEGKIELAEQLIELGKPDEAIALLLPLVRAIVPSNGSPTELEFGREAYLLLARLSIRLNDESRTFIRDTPFLVWALEFVTALLHHNPNLKHCLIDRGWIFERLRNYEGAVEDFTAALLMDPMLAQAYESRGRVRTLIGDYATALEDYSTAINLTGGSQYSYYGRACLYGKLADEDSMRRAEYLSCMIADLSNAIRLMGAASSMRARVLKTLQASKELLYGIREK